MSGIVWGRTAERSTWAAEARGAVLAVTRSLAGGWLATVTWNPRSARPGTVSHRLPTRLAAQRWAEQQAGAR